MAAITGGLLGAAMGLAGMQLQEELQKGPEEDSRRAQLEALIRARVEKERQALLPQTPGGGDRVVLSPAAKDEIKNSQGSRPTGGGAPESGAVRRGVKPAAR